MMIRLTGGQSALVDEQDMPRLVGTTWWMTRSGSHKTSYACGRPGGVRTSMHRTIMGLPPGDKRQVDHINGNGLDNRRCNLRICERWQNHKNSPIRKTNKTGFKGVGRSHRNFSARLTVNGLRIYIGTFGTKEEAARAYDTAAIREFGEFAKTNHDMGLL